ncbi:helicase-exonuclease AddAB subunit AddA [Clostridium hydrogenum]|uniref:helicase-exonuclease AddAB subunit AddA n=1 Tax=Clostridium hydrogenum TaxID=2855764 RepID=UPI001F2CC1A6|nr:helicase-exonuclease AddAB subunit AddA [Clostridium hydrogenum]
MSNKWTEEQLEAINSRGSNLLVAAAAGAGKTAVLVERIIKIITNEESPVDIDKLLVVTFTNAAASEMRERIGKAVAEKLYKNPNSKIIQRQLSLLSKSKITTIHSFCLDTIKSNFHCIDIDPDFRVGDETETLLLKNETLNDLFEEKYLKAQYSMENNKNNETIDFLKLVDGYCSNKNDSALFDMVMNLYNFAMSNPWPCEWINTMVDKFNVADTFEFGASPWAKILLDNIKIELSGMKNSMTRALNIIENCSSLESYSENFKLDINMIDDLMLASSSFESFYESLKSVEFKTLKRCGKDAPKEKQKIVKDIRDDVKKHLTDIKNNILSEDKETLKEEIKTLYPLMKALGDTVIEFNKRYSENKRKKNIIDFNDFEHMCLEILTDRDEDGQIIPSKIALQIRDKYDEILVDEYQDSNMVQEVILGAISRKNLDNPNLFMVGDVKQSIYRFRQANPKLFLEKYNTYSIEKAAKNRKILLYKNFRSRKEVLDGVNFIFKQIMSENIGELDYNETEFLNPGAKYKELDLENAEKGGEIELLIIEKNKNKEENITETENEEENVSNIMLEARLVARKIIDLVKPESNFCVIDKESGEYRKAEFKDIVILLRSTKSFAPVFSEELKNLGIPVFADTNSGYFESPEIKTVLSLLQIIDNPIQDIAFVAVLKSPIGGFSVEELIDIKVLKGDSFYEKFLEAVKGDNEEIEGNLIIKITEFMNKLNTWRGEALYMPIDEFIWHLYTVTGYYGYVGAVKAGAQRQANLRMLFQRAKAYNETSYKGLFNFINFINKIKVSSGDMGSAKVLSENENVVRIMSIHKSKGLEFPIVIAAGCGKKFNLLDINKNILFHNELGFGPDYVNSEKRISYPTLIKEALKNKIKVETLSEEMRILYVAFTRAREKLIITGAVDNIEKAVSKWSADLESKNEKISGAAILKGNSYLDWICSAVIRHKTAEKLRDLLEVKPDTSNLISDESIWKICFIKREDILKESKNDISEKEDKKVEEFYSYLKSIKESPSESNFFNEIERRLNYKYAYEKSSKLPALLSVTELKRRFIEDNEESTRVFVPALVKKPLFLENIKGLTPSEKGTALHSVMQHLKFSASILEMNKDNIQKQIDEMVISEILTDKQAESVDINKIMKFFDSSIAKRMLASKKIYREFPFQMKVKSTDIYENLIEDKYEAENIIIQGIVDLYFEEEDGIVLLDYKTDYVTEENIESIRERYKAQINYYSKALEKVTELKVKEKYLYLFSIGKLVKM